MLHQSTDGNFSSPVLSADIGIPLFLFSAIVCTFVKGENGMKGKIKKYVALVFCSVYLKPFANAVPQQLEDRCFPAWRLWTEKAWRDFSFRLWISQAQPEGYTILQVVPLYLRFHFSDSNKKSSAMVICFQL